MIVHVMLWKETLQRHLFLNIKERINILFSFGFPMFTARQGSCEGNVFSRVRLPFCPLGGQSPVQGSSHSLQAGSQPSNQYSDPPDPPCLPQRCSNLFNFDLTLRGPPPPDMFKRVKNEAWTFDDRAVGILLECILVVGVYTCVAWWQTQDAEDVAVVGTKVCTASVHV